MKKSTLSIKTSQFAKVHAKLKKFDTENKALKIGNMSLSNFLVANMDSQDDAGESKEVRTKRIILHIAGDFSRDPQTLQNSIQLKSNLGYGDDEYSLLQIRLDKLVKESNKTAGTSPAEINNCAKVGDCVSLVNAKTSPSV